MRRPFLVRILIILGLVSSAHYYLWLCLVARPQLAEPWAAIATIAVIALYASIPVGLIAMRRWPRTRSAPVLWVAYRWMGLGLYVMLASAVAQIVGSLAGVDATTRALVGLGAGTAIALFGFAHARRYRVKRVTIELPDLPVARYTIAQLTDVHVGPTLRRPFVERLVRDTNALGADAIAITGDLVDGTVDELRVHVEPLGELRARDGVYFVTGNHEYYWGADAWLARLVELGVRPLRNERVRLHDAIDLAGVDDSTSRAMLRGHGEDIPRAVAGRDPALPLVLLAHHPSAVERAAEAGCDVQLSGHVHGGGQMVPLGWIARLFERYIAGLYRVGPTQLYVSEGTGFWGPPIRVGTTSEITLITLASSRSAADP